jgi:hypothetical protein
MDHQAFAQLLGNYGEFIGSIAVLATLVYLAVQVRHSRTLLDENQRISLSQAYQSRTSMRFEAMKLMLDHADVMSKYMAGGNEGWVANFEKLTPSEQFQVRSFQSTALQAMDNSLYQAQLGLIDQRALDDLHEMIRTNYPVWVQTGSNIPPSVQDWYRQNVSDEVDA